MATLTLATETQAALFLMEVRGQLSDGMWENTRPYDHWKPWCLCTVIVGSNPGRDFSVKKDRYALASKQLLDVVGGRMLTYARLALAFGLDVALDLGPVVDLDGGIDLPSYVEERRDAYASTHTALAAVGGVDVVRKGVADRLVYDRRHLLADLRAVKVAMRTKV